MDPLMRMAGPDDHNELMRLYRHLHPDETPGATATELETFNDILAAPNLHILVAEGQSALVATCYLNIIPNLTRGGAPYGVIENVVTDETHRRCGLGKAVVGRALQVAWDVGCYKVMLMTGSRREATHNFYKACGFSPDEKFAFLARPPA